MEESESQIRKITALGRPLDPSYPTNAAIMGVTLVVGLVAGAAQFFGGRGLLASAIWAVNAAGGVFLAWALSRELDPEHDFSAFVSAALVIGSLFFSNAPNLLALAWFLWMARMLNRTTGLPATALDSLILIGLGGWLAVGSSGIYLLVTAAALLFDALLERGNRKQLLFAGLTVLAVVGLGLALELPWGEPDLSAAGILPWLAIAIAFVPVIVASRQVEAAGDAAEEALNPVRLQAAQTAALLAAVLIALFSGIEGALALLPLWLAFLGVTIYRAGLWASRLFAPDDSGKRVESS